MSIPLMIYLGVVSFAGSVFNFIVLLVFLSKRHFLQVPDVFLLSVAISDCLACVIAMPVTLLAVSNGSWQFDFELCKMHASLFYTFGLVSITHLSAMAFEKYLTLFKSTSTNGYYLTKGQAVKIIAALWGYSLVFSLSPLVGWGAYGLGPENITCTLLWGASGAKDDTYYGAVFLGCFFVPVGFILFSYYHISKLRRKTFVHLSRNSVCSAQMVMFAKIMKRKHIVFAMKLTLLIGAYFFAWLPYSVVSLLMVLRVELQANAVIYSSMFAKSSFLLNPVVYSFITMRFWEDFFHFLRRCRRTRKIYPLISQANLLFPLPNAAFHHGSYKARQPCVT
uniref:Opsin n=1 Tax=Nematostella vectensis TaxID=45351 RepID=A9UMW8_NEMVE|nr:TPA: opsin [Nematostella vectensis]